MRKRVNLNQSQASDEQRAGTADVAFDMTPLGEKRISITSLLASVSPEERVALGIHCGYMEKRNSSLVLWMCPSLTRCVFAYVCVNMYY